MHKIPELLNMRSKLIVGHLDTPLSAMDRATKNIIKEIEDLKNAIDQLDFTDRYRTIHTTSEYLFFSSVHGTLSRIDYLYMLGYKTSLSKCINIETIESIFSNHNQMKLEIKRRALVNP